jgi:hypothetical protein
MDVERIIDDIQQLQEMFEAPDTRLLSRSDLSAANRRRDAMLAHSPWFRLWQCYGVESDPVGAKGVKTFIARKLHLFSRTGKDNHARTITKKLLHVEHALSPPTFLCLRPHRAHRG